jgi:hypothetical protein
MSMPIVQADNTYQQIETMVRHLTGCSAEATLSSAEIQLRTNIFYSADFPYAIKLDQMRSVYTFYTRPNVDKYPLDVNYNQGVRSPVYVDGIQGFFYKDRQEFYNIWPKWPTLFNAGSSSLEGGITAVTQALPAEVTSNNHGLSSGQTIYIYNVEGMTQLNNNSYLVTVVDANHFTIGVDSTLYSAYITSGTWNLTPVTFQFKVPGPILPGEITIGGTDINGSFFTLNDDGNGNLQLVIPNPVISIPPSTTNPALPGMYNTNTGNPGLLNPTIVGSVVYATGMMVFSYPLPLEVGTQLTIWSSQYEPGRPYSLLFWNNYFIVRPVPKLVHRITVETYLTPVQFMMYSDSPILNQWVQYIAYGVACEILRQRQDMQGLANITEGFKRQEGLVLERQATEEINSKNVTIYSGSQCGQGWNQWWGGWY